MVVGIRQGDVFSSKKTFLKYKKTKMISIIVEDYNVFEWEREHW